MQKQKPKYTYTVRQEGDFVVSEIYRAGRLVQLETWGITDLGFIKTVLYSACRGGKAKAISAQFDMAMDHCRSVIGTLEAKEVFGAEAEA